jgi:membrane-associated phospholipid phosphatase
LNVFDYQLLLFLNHVADHSPFFTKIVVGIYGDELKSAFVVALLWWAWFESDGTRHRDTRGRVAAALCGSLAIIVLVRVLAAALPFRVRPIANESVSLHFPIASENWGHWSAFPSDNAVLFFFLTTCLFQISSVLGTIALLDTVLLISFPRVFVGVHHPTDILGGALIGVGAGYAVGREPLRAVLARPTLLWMRAHPASFYFTAFLISDLIAQVFWPALRLLMGMVRLVALSR